MDKEPEDLGLILGLGRSPGGGHGNPLQYPCLENPMDRGAWRITVHRVARCQTQLERLNRHIISSNNTCVTNKTNTDCLGERDSQVYQC